MMNQNKGPLILICDDLPDIREAIKNYLEKAKEEFRFLFAGNGKTSCDVALKRNPDLIIMDWDMPEMNGFEALTNLKSHPSTSNIPIIMATGYTEAEDLKSALDAGAADYIRKPIEKIELLARVRSCLALSFSFKEIRSKNEALQELLRERDGMTALIAHDMQTPFNRINGFVQLLGMEPELTHEQTVYLSRIKTIIAEGNNLIRDILEVNRYEQLESSVSFSEIKMPDFITEWIESYGPLLDKKSLKLVLKVPEESFYILSDGTFLYRILDNLISNAIKFSPRHSHIYLTVINNQTNFDISIRDEGPGISRDSQLKLFKKFQKLEARPTGGETSNGLGLAIVKVLVDQLQGEILVESDIKKGATFAVRLPIGT